MNEWQRFQPAAEFRTRSGSVYRVSGKGEVHGGALGPGETGLLLGSYRGNERFDGVRVGMHVQFLVKAGDHGGRLTTSVVVSIERAR